MKKVMIAAAAAMLGIAANAASFTWNAAANFCAEDGSVYTAATAPAGSIVLVYLGSGTADWDAATVVNEGTVNFASSMGSVSSKAGGTFTFAANTDYKNGDLFGVMFKDGDGNLSKLAYVSDGSEINTTYTISGLADDSSSLDGFTYATAAYTATTAAVPEPTSGLLLLLGMAGLALRRKQK